MAIVALIAAVTGNIVASHIDARLGQYHWLAWLVFGVSALIVVLGSRPRPVNHDSQSRASQPDRNVMITGNVNSGIVITGDQNTVRIHRDAKSRHEP